MTEIQWIFTESQTLTYSNIVCVHREEMRFDNDVRIWSDLNLVLQDIYNDF